MNKKIFFLILFLLQLNVVFSQKRVFFDRLENKNEIYYYDNQPFTGVSLQRHDSTKKKMIELNWKDGLLHGTKTTWFPNEALRQTLDFDMGKKHGSFITYFQNGKVKEKGNYHYDTLHGLSEGFYENGNLKFKFNYNKGEKVGLNELYFENGQIEQKLFIKNGKIEGLFESWYPTGKKMKEINYKNGQLHGIYKTWHMDGSVAEEREYFEGKKHGQHLFYEIFIETPFKVESYNKGVKHGVWITRGIEGDTLKIENYKNNVLHGYFKDYHKGSIENEGNYVNGKKDGFWKQNMSSRIGGQEGSYKLGVRIGLWTLYDINGLVLARITFDDTGEIIDEKWFGK